jgi:hypothetical protein
MTLRSLTGLVALLAVVGCEKKPAAPPTVAPPPTTPAVAPPTTPAPEVIDPRNTNRGGGAITGGYRAGKRTNLLNDMRQLGALIEVQYSETNRMPDPAAIKANLTTARNILKEIDDGYIVLTGTKDHAGLWAYEVDSDKVGGVVLIAGTAQRMPDAYEVKQLLGKK